MGRKKVHVVRLTPAERSELQTFTRRGEASAQAITRGRILLKSDTGNDGSACSDEEIAQALDISEPTVYNVRRRWSEGGLERALHRKKRATPPTKPLLDGAGEKVLFKIAATEPPDGRARWTLQLLADRLGKLKVVQSICIETVRKSLKKGASDLT